MSVFDPDVADFLEPGRRAGKRPFEALTPAEARAAYAASRDALQAPVDAVASVLDKNIPGAGGEIRLRTYRGTHTAPHAQLPCLVFLHGGSWVIGNLESHGRVGRRLANLARICVVAVDYRLAPQWRDSLGAKYCLSRRNAPAPATGNP